MKEKLLTWLGSAGEILYYVIIIVISALPAVFIAGDSWLWRTLIILAQTIFQPSMIVFWIWGLVKAIGGKQDVWDIIYYIVSVVVFLPVFGSIISSFFKKDQY